MKKLFIITLLSVCGCAFAETDEETLDYCMHKYEQVTMDVAYENLGCNFSKKTQKLIYRNRENTFLNCESHLDDETRTKIVKQSISLANVMIKQLGKDNACNANADLYPDQIYS